MTLHLNTKNQQLIARTKWIK